jgi:RNA polymerase sigma-70 factor, ECF subfamily
MRYRPSDIWIRRDHTRLQSPHGGVTPTMVYVSVLVAEPEEGIVFGSDSQLVEATLRGNERAFRRLVDRYSDSLAGFVSRLIGSRDDMEDVVQETFIRAYRALGSFRGDAPFKTWLYRIALHASLRHREQTTRRTERFVPVSDEGREQPVSREPLADDHAEMGETREMLSTAFHKLNQDDRTIVVSYYFADMTCEEIAQIIGSTQGAVKTRLHRARARLKALLEETWSRHDEI